MILCFPYLLSDKLAACWCWCSDFWFEIFTFLFYVFSDFVWSAGDHLIGLQQPTCSPTNRERGRNCWKDLLIKRNQPTYHTQPSNQQKISQPTIEEIKENQVFGLLRSFKYALCKKIARSFIIFIINVYQCVLSTWENIKLILMGVKGLNVCQLGIWFPIFTWW